MSRRRRPVLRMLRALPEPWHRPLAKTLFRVAGWLSKVRTYQRYYTYEGEDPTPDAFKLAGRHWSSCTLSLIVLDLSMQLDWDHWDCWAVVHEGCDPMPCEVCGGCRCADIDVVEDDEPDPDVSRGTEAP
jgi:hypothetical protein